eukprot:TRINITY_DN2675_c0_g1_i1.p1 TRINITY_DN2675_c0_g1~~TRINITY_DN2675_c0_g1_i1.p1  ORF type:complete len:428 (-),score=116.14 TRINITY_DN2675_c0_g1_i1:81-1364(-)
MSKVHLFAITKKKNFSLFSFNMQFKTVFILILCASLLLNIVSCEENYESIDDDDIIENYEDESIIDNENLDVGIETNIDIENINNNIEEKNTTSKEKPQLPPLKDRLKESLYSWESVFIPITVLYLFAFITKRNANTSLATMWAQALHGVFVKHFANVAVEKLDEDHDYRNPYKVIFKESGVHFVHYATGNDCINYSYTDIKLKNRFDLIKFFMRFFVPVHDRVETCLEIDTPKSSCAVGVTRSTRKGIFYKDSKGIGALVGLENEKKFGLAVSSDTKETISTLPDTLLRHFKELGNDFLSFCYYSDAVKGFMILEVNYPKDQQQMNIYEEIYETMFEYAYKMKGLELQQSSKKIIEEFRAKKTVEIKKEVNEAYHKKLQEEKSEEIKKQQENFKKLSKKEQEKVRRRQERKTMMKSQNQRMQIISR